MKNFAITIALLLIYNLASAQFISEIHYDNAGADTGEGVEVTVPALCECPSMQVVHYNGSGGTIISTSNVAFAPGPTEQYISVPFGSLQNSTEGLALICAGLVAEFISYEGVVTATAGPASGLTSTDIGVVETVSTPIGESLQLTDAGWQAPATASFGALNADTSTSVECFITPITLASFTAELASDSAVLKWTTLSEENNDFIEIQRSFNGLTWQKIGEVDGQGTVSDITNYEFEDKNVINGTTFYQLKQFDFDGTSSLSDIVSITTDQLTDLEIGSANRRAINLSTSLEGNASYKVYNSMGELIATADFVAIKGNQSLYFRSGEIASGFYIIQVEISDQVITKKFVIQ